jgi:2'-5' RNA ligase
MHRLFVALPLPEDVADSILELQTGLRGARWAPFDNLHLTLAFIGETDRHGLEDAASALASVEAPAFEMRLSGCGFFGDRKPHAVWVGAKANDRLAHLQGKVAAALRRAGFDIEKRKFAAHVTTAYLAGASRDDVARYCAGHGLFSAGPFAVEEFCLYESSLGAEGAHYEVVAAYPLLSA